MYVKKIVLSDTAGGCFNFTRATWGFCWQCAHPFVFLILCFLFPPSETNTLLKEFSRGVEVPKIIKILPVLWKWMTSYSKKNCMQFLMEVKRRCSCSCISHMGQAFKQAPERGKVSNGACAFFDSKVSQACSRNTWSTRLPYFLCLWKSLFKQLVFMTVY